MFTRAGAFAARHPAKIVLAWLLLCALWIALAVGGVAGQSLFQRLTTGEPMVAGSESQLGRELLDAEEATGEVLSAAVTGIDLTDPETLAQTQRVLNAFRSNALTVEGVLGITDPFGVADPFADPAAGALLAQGSDGFLVSVGLDAALDADAQEHAHSEIVELLEAIPGAISPDASVLISSEQLFTETIVRQLEQDLTRGELIALPLSLLIMVVVFGGFLAAGIPILGALASIAGGFGALLGFSYLLELESSVVNVVTVMALGLSIDYGLLIVSRFREEIRLASAHESGTSSTPRRRRARGVDVTVGHALRRTMETSGRTVLFSGVTVAISVSGLMFMQADLLRAVGAAGVSVVLIAVATAMTLVPALLALLGSRMLKPSLLARVPGVRAVLSKLGDVPPVAGFFSRLATTTQRQPVLVMLACLVLLVLAASPLLSVQLRNSTTALLPAASDQRAFLQVLEDDFPQAASAPVTVLAEADGVEELRERVARVGDVTQVDPPVPVSAELVTFGVRVASDDAGGEVVTDVVRDLRGLRDAGADLPQYWVLGQAASQLDFIDSMADGAPIAAGVVILAIFVLLFLMTGSVLVPLKALVVNSLSLAAGLGITAWVFAEGHLEGVLSFTSPGGLESIVVAMVIAFGFGLAMDYEVFLLARIKERYDAGEDNDASVRNGLQRTGRVITSAALVMIVVFSGFMTGEMLIIKEVGFAIAVTVFLDATVVRMLLVPATMTVLGDVNWWAPAPLRRLYRRFALRH